MDVLGYLPNVSYVQAFTGVSSQSVAGSATNCLLIRLVADTDCFVNTGINPVVTATSGVFMPAGSVEYFKYEPGWKIAVIQKSGPGNLFITEMSR
jgi:hypothetical protein